MVIYMLTLFSLILVPSSLSHVTDTETLKYKAGIEALISEAKNHTFTEKDFDTNLEVEAVGEHYDFIIIGAGASGSVIANRLSENCDYKVLLLEAGAPETPYTQIPDLALVLQNTNYSWGYVTTPQQNACGGMVNNQCNLATGKALGGSTAINEMYCTRGNPEDYNQWASMGNDGWSYHDVLPYLKKLENADIGSFDPEYRHRGGPLHIEYPRYSTISNPSLSAGKELGLHTLDYNAKEQLGMGLSQLSTKRGKRYSTAQAYLVPARNRSNLIIKPLSHVTKIMINPDSKEATGVEFLQNGKLYTAQVKKEVILSAGAINTAQILMLSGIGPKKDLQKFNIPVIVDLNVGKHLKNHVTVTPVTLIYNTTKSAEDHTEEITQYLKNGRGPLTIPGRQVLGFIKTEVSKHKRNYPDIELFFTGQKPPLLTNPLRLKPEFLDRLYKPIVNKTILQIGVILLHPKSTGWVVLKDKDPLHYPLIDLNMLSDPDGEDVRGLLAGIKAATSFARTEAMKNLVVSDQKVPGCESYKWESDDYWKCAIKLLATCLHHMSGTAKMGPKSDKDAVVDKELKLYGVSKLRVADASVIPVTMSGHTMIPSITIGEKASDLIKETWK